MVDLYRAYRLWLLRHLSLLVPAFLAAVAVAAWVAFGPERPLWLQVLTLALTGLSLAVLGSLLAATVWCGSLHRTGRRAPARSLRDQLSFSGRATAGCLAVLVLLLGAPPLFDDPDRPPAAARRARRTRHEPPPAPAVDPSPPTETDPPQPDVKPLIDGVPGRMEFDGRRFDLPDASPPLIVRAPPLEAVEALPESGFPKLPLELLTREALELRPEPGPSVNRLGLPSSADPDGRPRPWVRLEVLSVTTDAFDRGAATRIEADVPVGAAGSLFGEYQGVAFGENGDFEELLTDFAWHRVAAGYRHRLAGYAREAAFDLAVSLGFSLDQVDSEVAFKDLDSRFRVSPYIAVEAGLWQDRSWGLMARAGQSIPTNLASASSAVTDLSALVRIDLAEGSSFYIGYRWVIVSLKDYGAALGANGGQDEYDAEISGPMMGFEVRL